MTQPIPLSLTLVLAKTNATDFKALVDIAPKGEDRVTLSDHKALDIAIMSAVPAKDIQAEMGLALTQAGLKVDVCVQRAEGRRKSLLICDMDSTLIGQECIDELADFAGVKDRVSEITERAMRGELNFEAALTERVGLLKGLPLSNLQTCFDNRITLNVGARTLARTMSVNGAKTVIVSGGFTFFSSRIAKAAGFDVHQANVLEEIDDALTGTVTLPILGREAKLNALKLHSNAFGGPENAVAIGDGANDLAMITAAGLGIAFYAKPTVADAAHCAIKHTDLTTALYYQGYRDSDFVD